jgi:hypothetical protein
MRKQPTDADRARILELFLAGHGVNHTVFLMNKDDPTYMRGSNWGFDIDDINQVIRQEMKDLKAELASALQELRSYASKLRTSS